jgi:hypothetical protein
MNRRNLPKEKFKNANWLKKKRRKLTAATTK